MGAAAQAWNRNTEITERNADGPDMVKILGIADERRPDRIHVFHGGPREFYPLVEDEIILERFYPASRAVLPHQVKLFPEGNPVTQLQFRIISSRYTSNYADLEHNYEKYHNQYLRVDGEHERWFFVLKKPNRPVQFIAIPPSLMSKLDTYSGYSSLTPANKRRIGNFWRVKNAGKIEKIKQLLQSRQRHLITAYSNEAIGATAGTYHPDVLIRAGMNINTARVLIWHKAGKNDGHTAMIFRSKTGHYYFIGLAETGLSESYFGNSQQTSEFLLNDGKHPHYVFEITQLNTDKMLDYLIRRANVLEEVNPGNHIKHRTGEDRVKWAKLGDFGTCCCINNRHNCSSLCLETLKHGGLYDIFSAPNDAGCLQKISACWQHPNWSFQTQFIQFLLVFLLNIIAGVGTFFLFDKTFNLNLCPTSTSNNFEEVSETGAAFLSGTAILVAFSFLITLTRRLCYGDVSDAVTHPSGLKTLLLAASGDYRLSDGRYTQKHCCQEPKVRQQTKRGTINLVATRQTLEARQVVVSGREKYEEMAGAGEAKPTGGAPATAPHPTTPLHTAGVSEQKHGAGEAKPTGGAAAPHPAPLHTAITVGTAHTDTSPAATGTAL